MALYKQSDLKLVDDRIEQIVNDIEQIRKELHPRPNDTVTDSDTDSKKTEKVDPSYESVKEIVALTLKFVSDKKRKIYGGYSHNNVIKLKNKKDAIYSDEDAPDIDVYSPSPIEDLVELCDILYNNGFTDVIGKEAMHKETYKIFTNGYNAIDLSYVPKNLYDNIPYVEIDNIRYTHPSFAMIDLYRMMSEPLFSSWRWGKIFKRLYLLQKYYPFQKITSDITIPYKHKANKNELEKITNIVNNFIKNNDNVYLFGDFAYNFFAEHSYTKKIKPVSIGIYHIVSTNYKEDAKKLIENLKNKNIKITTKEFYPFWTFTDYSVEIIYEGETIVKLYGNLKRCCPTIKIPLDNNYIQIGSFDFVLLMEMVLSFRQKVVRNRDKKKYHDTLISNLILLREQYLTKNNLTLFDTSLYQSFMIPCIGKAVDPIMEAKEARDKKKKEKKKAYSFMYKPVKELKSKWVFLNTSGNEINNPKNLKLK